jgi:hypothetical protein
MKKFLLVLFTIFLLTACAPKLVPETQTRTRAGETIVAARVQRTADKNDAPAGDGKLLAIIETKTASGEIAKSYITQEPFNPLHPLRERTRIYQNEAAKQSAPATGGVVLPKFPWYHWPLICFEWFAVVAGIVALLYLRGLLAPVIASLKGLLWLRK